MAYIDQKNITLMTRLPQLMLIEVLINMFL